MKAIEVLKSEKIGLNSKESYVVVRGKTSFLRILGCEPAWELMTATASEDHGRIQVCSNQRRLVEAALRLGVELETKPVVQKDFIGREYVKICAIHRDFKKDNIDFAKQLMAIFEKFFVYYDNYLALNARGKDEMQELYNVLADDNQGEEVYLSDGIWLSSDGSVHDRGR